MSLHNSAVTRSQCVFAFGERRFQASQCELSDAYDLCFNYSVKICGLGLD